MAVVAEIVRQAVPSVDTGISLSVEGRVLRLRQREQLGVRHVLEASIRRFDEGRNGLPHCFMESSTEESSTIA
jgi:hypothetical protein